MNMLNKCMNLITGLLELTSDSFITYHFRPKKESGVVLLGGVGPRSNTKKTAIVMQGPIVEQNDFTLETVRLNKKIFSGCPIILSTWEGEEGLNNRRFEQEGITLIANKKPEYSGISNINLQIVSSREGIRAAKEMGVERVIKIRTDQRIYASEVLTYLEKLLELFPLKSDVRKKQKERIVGVSLNTFKYRLYGLSDMFTYGDIHDLLLFWDAPLDNRKRTVELTKKHLTLREFASQRVCEVYLVTEYLKKIERKIDWSLEDSWRVYAEHFCVIDKEHLDLFWPKYNRLEHRWLRYDKSRYYWQEVGFKDWISIYNGDLPQKNEISLLDKNPR